MLLPIEEDTVYNELLNVCIFISKRYFPFDLVMSGFAYWHQLTFLPRGSTLAFLSPRWHVFLSLRTGFVTYVRPKVNARMNV